MGEIFEEALGDYLKEKNTTPTVHIKYDMFKALTDSNEYHDWYNSPVGNAEYKKIWNKHVTDMMNLAIENTDTDSMGDRFEDDLEDYLKEHRKNPRTHVKFQ